jgi:phosphopantothenoylcysteine synthetase/decarboxylase
MALCAPAYGQTARQLYTAVGPDLAVLHLTRMADYQSKLETNEDVEARLREVLADPATKGVVFNVALCDYAGQIGDIPSGKYAKRLSSREGAQALALTPTPKLLQQVKALRPDVVLVGFKTTADAVQKEQHRLALRQIAETGANWVLANDTVTRHNLLVNESGFYSGPRADMLKLLVDQMREAAC